MWAQLATQLTLESPLISRKVCGRHASSCQNELDAATPAAAHDLDTCATCIPKWGAFKATGWSAEAQVIAFGQYIKKFIVNSPQDVAVITCSYRLECRSSSNSIRTVHKKVHCQQHSGCSCYYLQLQAPVVASETLPTHGTVSSCSLISLNE